MLSLFPGADLFGHAFELEGFCVVRGPDVLTGGDVRGWHCLPGKFEGIIGGPPCQSFSVAIASQNWQSDKPNLIAEFERVVCEAQPQWWICENVRRAPVPCGAVWSEVLDAWEFGSAQHRLRRFSSNLPLAPVPVPLAERVADPFPTVTATENKCSAGSGKRAMRQRAGRKIGRRLTLAEVNSLMGLPADYATPALTVAAAYAVRGNGVPVPMGRALARAVVSQVGSQFT